MKGLGNRDIIALSVAPERSRTRARREAHTSLPASLVSVEFGGGVEGNAVKVMFDQGGLQMPKGDRFES